MIKRKVYGKPNKVWSIISYTLFYLACPFLFWTTFSLTYYLDLLPSTLIAAGVGCTLWITSYLLAED